MACPWVVCAALIIIIKLLKYKEIIAVASKVIAVAIGENRVGWGGLVFAYLVIS